MLLALILTALAHAAPIHPTVGGLGATKAAQVLLRQADSLSVLDCNDAGIGPDSQVDGRWTCDPVAVGPGVAQVGLLLDGRLTELGEAAWSGAPTRLSIRREGGALSLSTESELNPIQKDALPAGPGRIVVMRVEGYPDAGTPQMRLEGELGAVQIGCGDDGAFPDQERNDGQLGCVGRAPGAEIKVTVYGAGGGQRILGTVRLPDQAVTELRVHVAEGRLESSPFGALDKVLVAVAKPDAPPPQPDPGPGGAEAEPGPHPDDPSKNPPQPEPQTEPEPQPQAQPQPEGGPAARPSQSSSPWPAPGVLAFGLLAAAIAGGVGAASRKRARSGHLPALERLPAPPLLPGGPPIGEGGVQLRCADPQALARALLPVLAASRRVVVAGPDGLDLPPTAGASVYRSTRPRVEDLVDSLRILAARHGPELAVLLVGADALVDPGAVAGDPAAELERALPPGSFLVQIVGPDSARPSWLPCLDVVGPPWRIQGADAPSDEAASKI